MCAKAGDVGAIIEVVDDDAFDVNWPEAASITGLDEIETVRVVNPPRGGRPQRVISILERSEMKEPPRDFTTAAELVHFSLYEYIGRRAHEAFIVVYANGSGENARGEPMYHIVGFSEYTIGSNVKVPVEIGGIFRDALGSGAQGMITVHQHPSGNATPSGADRNAWATVRAVSEVLGIALIDNLVLGENDFYSEYEDMKGNDPITSYARLRIMMP